MFIQLNVFDEEGRPVDTVININSIKSLDEDGWLTEFDGTQYKVELPDDLMEVKYDMLAASGVIDENPKKPKLQLPKCDPKAPKPPFTKKGTPSAPVKVDAASIFGDQS